MSALSLKSSSALWLPESPTYPVLLLENEFKDEARWLAIAPN
jgi:hypothetical protein